jgi:2-haloacid dehalogenase/putative hydrolase of the HAD superfamily
MRRRMALPKNIEWVTFDVYGTLIDIDSGVFDAFKREAARDGFTIEDKARDQIVTLFHETSREVEGGSYELYAEVLRQTAVKIAKEIGWPLEPSRSGFLPDSVMRWGAFKETAPQLKKIFGKYQTGLIANIDDKLLGLTRRHIPGDFDLVVTAQQVRSYKPDPAHFNEFARRIGGKKGWVHITSSHHHDVEPCVKLKVPTIWVNRRKEPLEPGAKKPTEEVRTMLEAVKLLGL